MLREIVAKVCLGREAGCLVGSWLRLYGWRTICAGDFKTAIVPLHNAPVTISRCLVKYQLAALWPEQKVVLTVSLARLVVFRVMDARLVIDGANDDLAPNRASICPRILLQNPISNGDIGGRATEGGNRLPDHLPNVRLLGHLHSPFRS